MSKRLNLGRSVHCVAHDLTDLQKGWTGRDDFLRTAALPDLAQCRSMWIET